PTAVRCGRGAPDPCRAAAGQGGEAGGVLVREPALDKHDGSQPASVAGAPRERRSRGHADQPRPQGSNQLAPPHHSHPHPPPRPIPTTRAPGVGRAPEVKKQTTLPAGPPPVVTPPRHSMAPAVKDQMNVPVGAMTESPSGSSAVTEQVQPPISVLRPAATSPK